ncbi:MAG TPA: winged helix-turn-helix domain-containing protein [Polyangiaceae bacterium]|nr:winged helix-turn-helix domain-containing protein [Polyangiaceae bacterium]
MFVDGGEVHLTPTEYKLLVILVRNAGKVVTHNQLLHEAWGPGLQIGGGALPAFEFATAR